MSRLAALRLAFIATFTIVSGFTTDSNKAQAGLLPVSVTSSAENGGYRYTYGVTLQSDTLLRHGDYFTIYDFNGFKEGTNGQPANFTFTSSLEGPTSSRVNPTDDPRIPNLTWTYNGPDASLGQLDLGSFSAISQYYQSGDGVFTARTHRSIDNVVEDNITDTTVPVQVPQVPEPSTFLLLAAGLPLVGLMRRYTKVA